MTVTPRVCIIGVKASGKTTIAGELAELSGLEVIDTDALVAQRVGVDAGTYLLTEGQEACDAVEDAALTDALAHPGIVVIGPGALDRDANLAAVSALADDGTLVVEARPTLGVLVDRLGFNQPRPVGVGAPRRWLREHLARRQRRWSALRPMIVDTSGASPDCRPVVDAMRARGFSPLRPPSYTFGWTAPTTATQGDARGNNQ